jgi:hypothetical protein
MFITCFHKCIVCHEHHTYIMTHYTSHFLWYRYVLINLIMCTWHLRPKYVFLSRHIFRGSNLYYKTNMFPWVSRVLSLRLKGKWSIRQRHRFHSTPSVLSILCRYFAISQNWSNLSLIFTCTNGGESKEGSPKSSFFAINAKGGESNKPKAKGLHHHLSKIFSWYISNWYDDFQLVYFQN